MWIMLIKRPDHCRTLVKRRLCQIGGLQTWNHFAMLTTTPPPDPHIVIFHWITKLNTVYLFVIIFLSHFFLKCFPGSLMYCSLVSVLLQEAFLKINVDPTVHHPVCRMVVIKGSGLFSAPGNTHTLIRYCLTSIRPCGFRQRPLFLFSHFKQVLLKNAVHPQPF